MTAYVWIMWIRDEINLYPHIPQTERLEGSFSEGNQEVLPELGRMNNKQPETADDNYRYWEEEIRDLFLLELKFK